MIIHIWWKLKIVYSWQCDILPKMNLKVWVKQNIIRYTIKAMNEYYIIILYYNLWCNGIHYKYTLHVHVHIACQVLTFVNWHIYSLNKNSLRDESSQAKSIDACTWSAQRKKTPMPVMSLCIRPLCIIYNTCNKQHSWMYMHHKHKGKNNHFTASDLFVRKKHGENCYLRHFRQRY